MIQHLISGHSESLTTGFSRDGIKFTMYGYTKFTAVYSTSPFRVEAYIQWMVSNEKQGNYLKDVKFGLKMIDDGGDPHFALINNSAASILIDPDGICESALWLIDSSGCDKYRINGLF